MTEIDKTIYGCEPDQAYAIHENGNPLVALRYNPDLMVKIGDFSFLKMSTSSSGAYVINWDSGKKLVDIRKSLSDFHENVLASQSVNPLSYNRGNVNVAHEMQDHQLGLDDYLKAPIDSQIDKEFNPYGMITFDAPPFYGGMVWRLPPLEPTEKKNSLDTVSMNISANLEIHEEIAQLILETSKFDLKEKDFADLSEVISDLLDTRNRVIGI